MSTSRCRPPCFSGGIRGSSTCHCSSVRSEGYLLRPPNVQRYHRPCRSYVGYDDRGLCVTIPVSRSPLTGHHEKIVSQAACVGQKGNFLRKCSASLENFCEAG